MGCLCFGYYEFTFICKCLCCRMLSFLLGIYARSGFTGSLVIFCLLVWGTAGLFCKGSVQFYIPVMCKDFSFSICLRCVLISVLLWVLFCFVASLVNVNWHLFVVYVCISLVTSDIDHLFMCSLAICISFWRNFYTSPLPIF